MKIILFIGLALAVAGANGDGYCKVTKGNNQVKGNGKTQGNCTITQNCHADGDCKAKACKIKKPNEQTFTVAGDGKQKGDCKGAKDVCHSDGKCKPKVDATKKDDKKDDKEKPKSGNDAVAPVTMVLGAAALFSAVMI